MRMAFVLISIAALSAGIAGVNLVNPAAGPVAIAKTPDTVDILWRPGEPAVPPGRTAAPVVLSSIETSQDPMAPVPRDPEPLIPAPPIHRAEVRCAAPKTPLHPRVAKTAAHPAVPVKVKTAGGDPAMHRPVSCASFLCSAYTVIGVNF